MRLSKKLVGIGVATSLILLPGCSDNKAELEPSAKITEATDFNPRVQALAGRILGLSPFATDKFTSKPPYTYGFSLPTDKGGTLTMSAQLSTELPNSKNVVSIQVSQSGIANLNYDLSLIKMPDDTWSAYCSKDGNPQNGVSEDSQQRALLGGSGLNQSSIDSPKHAEAVLDYYIKSANEIADSSQASMPNSEITALDKACGFNLGDGS